MEPIHSATALRRAIVAGYSDFRVLLNGGIYSRKTITLLADGRFKIVNHIDESVQKLTRRQLYTKSIIGEAMGKGAFVVVSPDDY